jgi:hypothetical protein
VGLRVGFSGGEVTREDETNSGTRSSKRPGCVPPARAGKFWPRTSCDERLVGATITNTGPSGNSPEGLPDTIGTVEVLWETLGAADTGTSVPLSGHLTVTPSRGSGRPRSRDVRQKPLCQRCRCCPGSRRSAGFRPSALFGRHFCWIRDLCQLSFIGGPRLKAGTRLADEPWVPCFRHARRPVVGAQPSECDRRSS